MKPAAFEYHRPQTLEAALGLLARYGDVAKPIAGGQSLGPMLNMRLARPGHLIDLNDLIELDFVRVSGTTLEIGAMARHHRVATAPEVRKHHPLLATAAGTVGHYAIRQRGTLGGSLVHADPAAQMPLIAILCDAHIVVQGPAGRREVEAQEFFQSIMTVDVKEGEMVTSVRYPIPSPGTGWAFEIFSRRRGDFAIVSVATMVRLDKSGRLETAAMAFGGVDAVPRKLDLSPVMQTGAMPDEEWLNSVSAFVEQSISPEDNAQVPSVFRKEVAGALSKTALVSALSRVSGVSA